MEFERQSVVSARGMQIIEFPRPEFMEVYQEGLNKEGMINLAMAENKVSQPKVLEKLREVGSGLVDGCLSYADYSGTEALRKAFAGVMARYMGGPVRHTDLTILNGAGPILAQLAFALTDPTDAVFVPAPLYYGFQRDLCGLSGAEFVTLTGRDPLSLPVLKKAFKDAKAKGNTPRVIVITNPGNPTGEIVDPFVVRGVAQWAADNNMHLILDEVYALSVFRDAPVSFRSGVGLWETLPQNVHIVWGLSKDLTASGLRVASLYTRNEQVQQAVRKFAYFFQSAHPLQHQLAAVLSDLEWVDRYVASMRADLLRSCEKVESVLRANSIDYLAPQGAFFVWCNFSPWCTLAGSELEFTRLLEQEGVLLVGGKACAASEGWFRLCFSSCSQEMLKVGLDRVLRTCKKLEAKAEHTEAKL